VNLPNQITIARLFLTLCFIILVSFDHPLTHIGALACFVVAALSDWLDGYLARKMNLVTSLGKLLDPLADKVLVCAGFIYLTQCSIAPLWVTCIILTREFMVTGLRQIAIEQGIVIAADKLGKWKTTLQLVFIISGLIHISLSFFPQHQSFVTKLVDPKYYLLPLSMWTATILTLLSGWNYLWSCREIFKSP